ncbi:unnamed protein product, partial [Mesorhabditis belari]|uniref:Uncharacterized protein n=1 Tax=Mesorhabditis belari TaxID=2138241 RepID=A0AAF3FPJ9_9BILA
MFGSTKRYVFLIVYFIVYSFGFGSSITLRTYLVDVSLPEDRSSVFALRTLAVVGGMLLPPLLQLPFTSLDYPGIAIGTDMIRLNVYSGPLLITFLANIIATLTVIFLLSEPRITKKAIELKKAKRSENVSSVPFLKRLSNFFLKPNFSWHLIIVICVVKVGIYAALSTVSVVHAAWAQIAFGWSSAETVVQMTKAKIILGSVSVGITLFLFKFSKKVGDHLVLLICSIFMLGYFFITYPLSPLTVSTTAPFNASTHGGCNESEYSWCGARVGNPDLWVYSSVTVIIIIAQVGLISSDAIFSNFLEKIDQNMMQGMVVLFSDGVQMTASMYSADMFTAWGLEPLWILNVALAAIILLISIVYFKRFRWKTE